MFFYQYGRLSSLWLLMPLIFGWSQIHATVRHEVVAGDTLSGISAQHLGSAHHWPLLHQRNVAHIPNPHRLYPKQQVRLRNAWYAEALVGAGRARIGKTQTLTMQSAPLEANGYSPIKGQAAYWLGLGGGHFFVLSHTLDFGVGLEADYIDYQDSEGVVHPLINVAPDFDTLNYRYHTKSYVLLGNVRLRWWYQGIGFIEGEAAVGAARNMLSDYQESIPAGSTASPMTHPFQNAASTQAAFSVGIALGYQVSPRWALALGYRYLNTGRAKFKAPDEYTAQPQLASGLLSANMLYLDVLFG